MSVAQEVRAAGLLMFRRLTADPEFLLLQCSRNAHWTPPKGHVDPGESDLETAIRETQEESGLTKEDYSIVEGYQHVMKYVTDRGPKTVLYWAAEVTSPEAKVVLSHEHVDHRWCTLDKACDLAEFPEMISALKECEEYIKKNIKR